MSNQYFFINKSYYLSDLLWNYTAVNSIIAWTGITGVKAASVPSRGYQKNQPCAFVPPVCLNDFFASLLTQLFVPPDTEAHCWDQFTSQFNQRSCWKHVGFTATWFGFYLQQHGDRWAVCLKVGSDVFFRFSPTTPCVFSRLFARHKLRVYGIWGDLDVKVVSQR